MSGTTTISNSTAAIGAIKIQQSTYGAVIPIIWGRTRVSGNLIWYGDFAAIPHTTTTQSGGKGGGGIEQSDTSYTYQAAVAMALCEGPVLDIVTTWRGKSIFLGSNYSGATARAIETTTYPAPGTTYTVFNTLGWANLSIEMLVQADYASDFSYNRAGSWVTLVQGSDYTCSNGVYTFNKGATQQGSSLRIAYTYKSNATGSSSLSQIGLNLMQGQPGQQPWSYLTSRHPSEALGYSGVAYVVGSNYTLDSGASVENHAFEVQTGFSVSSIILDADPSVIVLDALTNPNYGAHFGRDKIASLTAYSNASLAQGIVLSPALTEQMTAASFLDGLAQLTNVGLVWSGGQLKFVPFTDTQVTGNGVTYTPITTPIYDLTDDDFQVVDDEGPIRVKRGAVSDSFNLVKLEYLDRANDYNIAIMAAPDQADIQENGERAMPVVTAHWITETTVAKIVATLLLQRSMFVRNTYEFRLGWTKIALEPMDLVTLTDPNLGLNQQPVRIISIEEDDEGYLSVSAEDFPKGSASATLYPTGTTTGYTPNFNEDPGQVTGAPVIFEGPAALATNAGGLELWLAAGSLTPTYGGCQVWVSLTGANYEYAATLHGSSRFGTTSSALAASATGVTTVETVGVNLAAGGQMLAGTLTDMQSLTTLCYVDGEFIAYENAVLAGASAYTLGNRVLRGAYLSPANAHLTNRPFVRCDDAIAKVPLTPAYIGKTVYIKLLAFNRYGTALSSLATATEYTYTVTGAQANLPPIAPLNVGIEGAFTISTARFKWDRIGNAASYNVQIWAGATLAKRREVNVGDALRYDYTSADAVGDGGPWRALTIKVQGINANGAAGAFSTFAATNAQIGVISGAGVNSNSSAVQFTCDRPADPDFSGVRVHLSATSNFTPDATNLVYDGPNTNITINRTTGGALLTAGSTYYVKAAAYDTFGTDALTYTAQMSVTISNVTPVQSALVLLYQYASAQPAPPNGTTTYTWATGANTAYAVTTQDGWAIAPGTNPGTPGTALYVAAVTITAPTGTSASTVSYTNAAVSAWSKNGAAGAAGVQTAVVTVYRWDVTIPAGPSGAAAYRWSDAMFGPSPVGSSSVAPTNWTVTPGTSASPGYTLYAARVTLIDSANNASTAFNWTSASISVAGSSGAAGSSYVTAYCASASATATSAPAATIGKTSLPAANSGGITGTWSATVPTLTSSQYLYQVDGIYDPAANTVTWSIPYWSSLKVGTLSAISANLGTITAGAITINGGTASIDASGNAIFKSILIQDALGNTLLSSGNTGAIPTAISAAANTAVWSSVSGTGKPSDNATSDVTLVANNFMITSGNSATKTAAVANGLVNGTFTGGLAPWSAAGAATYVTGRAQLTGDGTTAARVSQSIVTEVGRSYKMTFTTSTNTVDVAIGTSDGASDLYSGPATAIGTSLTASFVATSATTWLSFSRLAVGAATVDNVSVAEVVGYDGSVYSRDSFTGGAFVTAVPTLTNKAIIFGLNSAADLLDPAWQGIDYAIYAKTDATLEIRESGATPAGSGSTPYAAGDVLGVVYDGSSVKYLKNGVPFWTSTAAGASTPNQTLFFDSSFNTIGGSISNIRFGPMTSNNWTNVAGAGKPADNATVGAPAGTLVAGVAAATVATAATNFNASNDRNAAAVVAPSILTDGTAVDHALRSDGAADVSFEWVWGGAEGDIDGFLIYVYQSTSSAAYTFGSDAANETVYTMPANKRAFILFGVGATQYLTFGAQAYRSVDKDINATGVIKSAIVKSARGEENPYRPSAIVAYAGDITGTINGIPAANVNNWSSVTGAGKPADNATAGSAINRDPNFSNAAFWDVVANNSGTTPSFAAPTNAPGASAAQCLQSLASASVPASSGADMWVLDKQMYPISSNRTYRMGANIYCDNGRFAYLGLEFYDSNGNHVSTTWGGAWSAYPVAGFHPANGVGFVRFSGDFGKNTNFAIPANVTQCRVGVILNNGTTTAAGGSMAAQSFTFSDITDGATFGVNLYGQITPGNASTYIADTAIGIAKIDKATITDLSALSVKVGTLRTATQGARIEIMDNTIQGFRSNNNPFFKITSN